MSNEANATAGRSGQADAASAREAGGPSEGSGQSAASAEAREPGAIEPGQRGFHLNAARCIGCKTCEFACRDAHDLDAQHTFRRVIEYEGGAWLPDASGTVRPHLFAYFISLACNHCDEPACMPACPTGALMRDEETGLVHVEAGKCTACGACAKACPYGAPHVDEAARTARKCDGCLDLVKAGEAPVCVRACPMRALSFGPVDAIASERRRASVAPLPPSDATSPNLFMREPRGAHAAAQVARLAEAAGIAAGTVSGHGTAAALNEAGHIGNPSELHVSA